MIIFVTFIASLFTFSKILNAADKKKLQKEQCRETILSEDDVKMILDSWVGVTRNGKA